MKTTRLTLLSLLTIVSIFLHGCNLGYGYQKIYIFETSDCKEQTEETEKTSITFKKSDRNEIEITHTNALLGCEQQQKSDITATTKNSNIYIVENILPQDSSCMCRRDLTYKVVVPDNGTYTIFVNGEEIGDMQHFNFRIGF